MQGPVILAEIGGVSLEAGPVEEEPSEDGSSILGTSPSYADHVEGPEAVFTPPPQEPSPGADRFHPSPVAAPVAEARPEIIHPSPVATPVAEARPEAIQTDQGEDDTWGPWRAQVAASSEAQDVRDVKRPRRGIPSGSRARVGAVPTPNESEEDLLKQVFQRELEVRRQEGEALGLRLRAEADEPLPLLSHFYGPPSPSQMHDSLALCLTDRSFLTRVALGGSGRSDDLVGGATGVSGRNRLSRPEEYGEPTPYVPPRPPRFPEEDPARRPLLIDQATITENALEEWHTWLKMAKQGRSLREWGLISADVITAVEYLGEAPPQEEPARGGHWSNAPRGGGKKKQKPPQEFPTAVGTLLYLKKALKAIDAFDGSPSGYRGLLLGPASAIGLEKPDGSSATDEKEAWKYLAAAVALRVQRLLDKKKAKNRMVDAMTAIWLQKPKAAAAKPRPVQPAPPRTPTTPAEESSDSSSEGVSEVSGESQLEGEGVAESIGILRSLGTETLWQPGVITRVFGTPALPVRLFPEVGAAASSSNPVGGIAAGTSAMAPPTPAATPAIAPPTPAVTEPKSPASLASVIHRPGMLVAKTLLASDGSTVPLPPGHLPRLRAPPLPKPEPNLPTTRPWSRPRKRPWREP
ncbi:unnamed protein product, partial [Symbiodinium sp. KB8]